MLFENDSTDAAKWRNVFKNTSKLQNSKINQFPHWTVWLNSEKVFLNDFMICFG